jgi:hypothetical protein
MEKFKCGHDKSTKNVGLVNKNKPKAGIRCKVCTNKKARDAYVKTAEKQKAYSREYRKKHSEQYREYLKKWHKQNPTKNAEYRWISNHVPGFIRWGHAFKRQENALAIYV